MDFSLTEEQKALRSAVRDFIDKEAPQALVKEWDENAYYPKPFYDQLAALGYFGCPFTGF